MSLNNNNNNPRTLNFYLPDSKKSGRPPNSVWHYFDKGNERFPGKYDASCKYCNDRSSRGSPQLMEEHLANNCVNVPVEVKKIYLEIVLNRHHLEQGSSNDSNSVNSFNSSNTNRKRQKNKLVLINNKI